MANDPQQQAMQGTPQQQGTSQQQGAQHQQGGEQNQQGGQQASRQHDATDGLKDKKPEELTPEELRLMADTMPGEGPGD